MRTIASAAVCGLILLIVAPFARAQFNAGIQGTIMDSTGAVLPGATVTVTSKETAIAKQVVTSDQGFYRVSALAPGKYAVSAELTGFKKAVIDNITVNAEEFRGVNLTLEIGNIREEVTVNADTTGPALATESADIGDQITSAQIQRLPEFGRDPYELLRLAPGVFGDGARAGNGQAANLPNTTGPGGSSRSIFQTENQVQIAANGQRLSANNFQIDGVSVNSQDWGGAAVVTPNQESVKQIEVVSETYSAEDGRNSGAQVKVVSQNGTNHLHGSGVFKYDDPKFNAFNKYGGPSAPPTRVNQLFRQFAGSLGGPIVKDKAFFFFSYEGLRSASSDTFNAYVETPEYRGLVGQLRPNGMTAKVFNSPGIEPRIVNVLPIDCGLFGNDPARCRNAGSGLDIGSPTGSLGQYVGLGNPAGGGLDGVPDIMYAQISAPGASSGNQYNTRIDYHITARHQLAVSTYFTRFDGTSADTAGDSRPMEDIHTTPLNSAVTLLHNWFISSKTLNEARFNATRFAFNELQSSGSTNFGIPRIEVEGLPFDRIRFGANRSETTPGVFAQNTYEFRDSLSRVAGNHGLKWGVEVRKEQDNNSLVGGARPLYSFSGLFNLANDTPIFEAINSDPSTGAPADAQRYFRTSVYALYAQDDWKLRPRLTLNLGLRWEYFTPLSEKRSRLSNIEFGTNGLVDSRVVVVDRLFQPDRNNFAPRIGFAWSPGGFDDKLVLRGGFGISFNRIPNALFANTRGNPPFFARYNLCCGTASTDFGSPFAGGQILYALGSGNSIYSYPVNPALAQGIDSANGAPKGGAVEIYGAPGAEPNAYVYNHSLGFQYSLPSQLVFSLGWQASESHKLIRLVNQNYLFKNNPAFFAVYLPQPDVNANYNAMNVELKRRFARGYQFDFLYRWSHSIDTLSYEGPGFVTNQTWPQDQRFERGGSDFDVRHNASLSGLWDLPFLRTRNDLLGRVFGGFQINGILTAHSGLPWTPLTGRCVSTPGGINLCPTRPIGYKGGALTDTSNDAFIRPGGNFPGGGLLYFDASQSGPPGIGRNSFRGPKYFDVDLSLAKRTALPSAKVLGESAYFEFRANLFNAFNKLNLAPFNFGGAGTFVDDPNFGRSPGGLAGRVVELQARLAF